MVSLSLPALSQAVLAQPTVRLWSHPLKAGARELREVMEPFAGTRSQANRILSSSEKLGQGQREGGQVQSARN